MKRILFVCVENSCRSQIAEAFALNTGQPKPFDNLIFMI
jgi:protein-tyrosine-phosphatase